MTTEQFERAVKAGVDELRKVYTGGDEYWDEATDDARAILRAALPFLSAATEGLSDEALRDIYNHANQTADWANHHTAGLRAVASRSAALGGDVK